jgi:peptidoglycan/xylan/chitin deacetylase (PgdA/CDA1 family)
MIYVRDDDILIFSSEWERPAKRFRQIHRWVCEDPHFLHIPTILKYNVKGDATPGILAFPSAIEYIAEETAQGRMRPEIHGLEHIDYGKKSLEQVRSDLREMVDFINEKFNYNPTTWYTPWGASQAHLHEAAALENLKLVDCSNINKLRGEEGVTRKIMDGKGFDWLEEQEIFTHWWEGGARLLRVIKAHKYGGWEKAAEEDPELFRS